MEQNRYNSMISFERGFKNTRRRLPPDSQRNWLSFAANPCFSCIRESSWHGCTFVFCDSPLAPRTAWQAFAIHRLVGATGFRRVRMFLRAESSAWCSGGTSAG